MTCLTWIGRLALVSILAAPGLTRPTAIAQAAPTPGSVPQKLALPAQSVDRLIVHYSTDRIVSAQNMPELPAGLDVASALLGVDLEYVHATGDGAHVLQLEHAVDSATAERMAGVLEAYPNVDYAEPDYRATALLTPGDALFAQQWALAAPADTHYGMNVAAAWDLTIGDPNLTVAVIDTGLLYTHPDLVDRAWPGYDFIADVQMANDGDGRDADATDPGDWTTDDECGIGSEADSSSWHGTHVAGIIGAAGDNGIGTAGVTWGARILPLRVLGRCGGYGSDIADAIYWAAGLPVAGAPLNPHPARVINMSLGGFRPACPQTYQNAIDAARTAGAVVVVAAGNSAIDATNMSPANCTGVVVVGATDRNGNLSEYSDFGALVDVSAPGGAMTAPLDPDGILSTYNEGTTTAGTMSYEPLQGTSMAAPNVAGVAALMLSANPSLSPDQVEGLLASSVTAFPLGSLCYSGCGEFAPVACAPGLCGAGIVNAGAAVAMASSLTLRQYLPVIANQPADVPLANSRDDFETSKAWPWTSLSSSGHALIGPAPAGWAARSGRNLAWLGGLDHETSSLERTLFVEPDATHLTLWHWIASQEPTVGADHASILVDGRIVWESDLSAASATAGWTQINLDLSAYVGCVVSLRFEAITDGDSPSSWLIDDASLSD